MLNGERKLDEDICSKRGKIADTSNSLFSLSLLMTIELTLLSPFISLRLYPSNIVMFLAFLLHLDGFRLPTGILAR